MFLMTRSSVAPDRLFTCYPIQQMNPVVKLHRDVFVDWLTILGDPFAVYRTEGRLWQFVSYSLLAATFISENAPSFLWFPYAHSCVHVFHLCSCKECTVSWTASAGALLGTSLPVPAPLL
jgi:hypothetical protein